MDQKDTGILLNEKNIKIQRSYFKQMVQLLGINVLFRAPIPESKEYNKYGELDAHFFPAKVVGCIFDEHPKIATMKKLGWNAETNETLPMIHVPYDLEGVQAGALFIIPSGLDNTQGRVFKVLRMSTIAVYPASIACELGPVIVNEQEKAPIEDFKQTNFNVLDNEEDEYGY